MKTKGMIALFLTAAFLVVVMTGPVYAFGQWGKGCKKDAMEEKLCKKAGMMLADKEALGLSDEQAAKIKEIKMAAKKNIIKMDAEIDIAALEVKEEMYKDPVDTAALDKLIDKKYDLKKNKAKAMVAAYADLKNVLTKEQKDKMKELHKRCKEERPPKIKR